MRANCRHQNGITHAFVPRFYSNGDRDHYVGSDPAHQAFQQAAGAVLEKTVVVNSQNSLFTKAEECQLS
ncbi:uncharacterized protein K460DRAFT_360436 [Cucurbitaria berberidis CBS 394.84]|uniref:Stress-response A/B barrel domain-containing protein n=1 Tax=Cucurbitaria berberidis CBS 394.84 TaxID=1168544 RepID=A0A9P4LC09_9PLEO|nr:uncharacterized protein K460DRAFT_360436 [Cucurbitaria berberidis CBS 394.84]KAF1849575.1 hypothetical protein K460DRAFT_360436 [Cucurbitaria berberidis CBS 394.84]